MLQNRSHSTPPFTYASTRRLPPHLTQTNTSKSNVLLRNPAQSTRGVVSFIRSFLAAPQAPRPPPPLLLLGGAAALERVERVVAPGDPGSNSRSGE
ncbi:hypothetical protein [Archangium violaceum]|uniref:hypothetical protein n=1 Tax=Archangium violaceum TaxID=83451 RepID=UPI001EF15D1F|nr:hypothetical protein [Archangium violaceum]